MSKKRYTEEQIIRVLKEVEAGAAGSEVCRKYGISEPALYNWKAKYGGLGINERQRIRELATERQGFGHPRIHVLLRRGKKWKHVNHRWITTRCALTAAWTT